MKNLSELVDASTRIIKTKSYNTDIIIVEEGETYYPYEACISYREITFYCENSIILYNVNCIDGVRNFLELVDIVKD